jgi:hypothetical protein
MLTNPKFRASWRAHLLKAAEETLAKLEGMRSAPEFTKAQIRLMMSLTDDFMHLGAKHARNGKSLAELPVEPYDSQFFLFIMGFRVGDALADQGYLLTRLRLRPTRRVEYITP